MDDIRVELTDEFDKNFDRKAFFDRPWAPLSPNYRPKNGSMLVRTSTLRNSIRPHVDRNTLTYTSLKCAVGLGETIIKAKMRSSGAWPLPNASGGQLQFPPVLLSAGIPW